MKQKLKIVAILAYVCCTISAFNLPAQSLSPKVIASAGGYFTGGGNSLSWTMGETFTTTLASANVTLTQGFQQPYFPFMILNLKAFIEGYYIGGGQMQSLLFNFDPGNHGANDCDSIAVDIHNASAPYNIVATSFAILQTDGNGICKLPSSLLGGSFYIGLRHRSCIETWSMLPVLMMQNTGYQFSTAASMAYGDNLVETIDNMGWAMYSGDITHDGAIDALDYVDLDPSIQAGAGGYDIGDLNGDLAVDALDYVIMDPNIQAGIGRITPP